MSRREGVLNIALVVWEGEDFVLPPTVQHYTKYVIYPRSEATVPQDVKEVYEHLFAEHALHPYDLIVGGRYTVEVQAWIDVMKETGVHIPLVSMKATGLFRLENPRLLHRVVPDDSRNIPASCTD